MIDMHDRGRAPDSYVYKANYSDTKSSRCVPPTLDLHAAGSERTDHTLIYWAYKRGLLGPFDFHPFLFRTSEAMCHTHNLVGDDPCCT